MRADGTAANKGAATSDAAASTAMSVATHNGETFSAGDTIIVSDKGGTYTALCIPPSDGTAGNVITYTNSGTPTWNISRAITVWAGPVGGVYTGTLAAGYPAMIYEDTLPLGGIASDATCADGNWYYTDVNFFDVKYKPTSGTPADHTVSFQNEDLTIRYAIDCSGRSYLTIDGLNFLDGEMGVGGADANYITVNNCYFTYLDHAVYFVATAGNQTGINVTNCTAYRCRCGFKGYAASSARINTVFAWSNLTIIDNCRVEEWGSLSRTDAEATGFQNLQSSTVDRVTISGGYQIGCALYGVAAVCSDNVFSRYSLTNNLATGLYWSGSGAYALNNNRFQYFTFATTGAAFAVNALIFVSAMLPSPVRVVSP